MRNTYYIFLTILLILFTGKISSSQNWECVKTTGEYYFSYNQGDEQHISKSIIIDSTFITGGYRHYIGMKMMRLIEYYCANPQATPFTGRDIYSDTAGAFYFVNKYNIPLKIESLAHLGQSWIFYQTANGSEYYIATVDSVIQSNVLGITDSVKVIRLQGYKNGQPFNYYDDTLRLSKSFGLTRVIDFFSFPENLTYSLRGMSNPPAGITNFSADEIYDMDPGDEFHIFENRTSISGNYEKRRIRVLKSKSFISPDTLRLTFNERYRVTSLDYPPSPDIFGEHEVEMVVSLNSRLFEQFDIKSPGQALYLNNDSTRIGLREIICKGVKMQKVYDGFPEYYGSDDYYCEDDPGYIQNYVKGCGGPYRSYYEYHDVWGEDLVYYKKKNITWGSPLGVPQNNDYECFRAGSTNIAYYSGLPGDSLRADLASQFTSTNAGSKTYFYAALNTIDEIDSCIMEKSDDWTGKDIVREYGDFIITNAQGDSMFFNRLQEYGKTKIFYRSVQKNLLINATVTQISQQSVFGNSQLVKKLTFKAFDLHGNPVNHPINDEYVLLSQKDGFLRLFNFKYAPDSLIVYELTGKSESGIHNIGLSDIYALESGDEVHYITTKSFEGGNSVTKTVRIILENIDTLINTNHYLSLTFREVSRTSSIDDLSGRMVVSNKDTTLVQLIDYNNEILSQLPGAVAYTSSLHDTAVITRLMIDPNRFGDNIVKYFESPSFVMNNGDSCLITNYDSCVNYYINGCGGPFKICNNNGHFTADSLVYYKKQSLEWGTPLDLLIGISEKKLMQLIKVYPNPASEYITFEADESVENPLLEVFNSSGVNILSRFFTGHKLTLLLNQFKGGIYFYNVTTDKSFVTGKFVVL